MAFLCFYLWWVIRTLIFIRVSMWLVLSTKVLPFGFNIELFIQLRKFRLKFEPTSLESTRLSPTASQSQSIPESSGSSRVQRKKRFRARLPVGNYWIPMTHNVIFHSFCLLIVLGKLLHHWTKYRLRYTCEVLMDFRYKSFTQMNMLVTWKYSVGRIEQIPLAHFQPTTSPLSWPPY